MTGLRVSGSEFTTSSPYTIVNYTGYPLYYHRDELMVAIKPGLSYPVTVPHKDARVITPKLTLAVDNHTGRYTLPELKVNMVSSRLVTIGNVVGPEDFRLFCDVEMEKNRKVVKIRSPIVIRNETSHAFQCILEPIWGKKTVQIDSESECSLPYDCLLPAKLTLLHEDFVVFQVEDIWTYLRSAPAQHLSLSDPSTFVYLHSTPHKRHDSRYVIHLLPPVIVSNALPLQCGIRMTCEAAEDTESEQVDSKGRLVSYEVRWDQKVFLRLKVPGFNETDAIKIFDPRKRPKPLSIRLTDSRACQAEVLVSLRIPCNLHITLHSPIIIDNISPLPLLFHYKKTGIMHQVAGQQASLSTDSAPSDFHQSIVNDSIQIQHNYFFCCSTKKLQLELDRKKSEKFKIGNVGAKKVVSVEGGKGKDGEYRLYQLVYSVQFIWMLDDSDIYCKLVTVSPRFIINNLLPKPMLIYQIGARKPVIVKEKTSLPWFWPDGRKQELLKISLAERKIWTWSGTFSISGIGACTLQCQNALNSTYFLIRMDIRQQDGVGLVTFQEESVSHPAYILENYSKELSVGFYQENYPEFIRYADINTNLPYTWASPLQSHVLILRFLVGKMTDFPVDLNEMHRINPDEVNTKRVLKVNITKWKGRCVYLTLFSRGSTKVMRISDVSQGKDSKKSANDSFAVVIPHLGVSLVENSPSKTSELLYISLQDFELEGRRSASIQHFSVSIKRIQVDNQYNPLAICPVLMSVQRNGENAGLQMELSYYLTGEGDCYNVEKAELLVQEVRVEAESLVVQRLIGLFSRISEEFLPPKPSLAASLPMQYRTSKSIVVATNSSSRLTQYSTLKIENVKQISFGYLKIHPILLSVTFVPLKDIYENMESDAFDMMIVALGLPIMNIKAAPMRFYALEIANVFGARWELMQTVSSFYSAQVASELFSIVGHADVLGNPLGILTNLGEGVADLFYEPCKAVLSNPATAGRGLAKGVKSFFSKTIYATFGTISRLTGTLSTGLNSLTSDRDFQLKLQKERARNQPKDVVDGLGNGVKAIVVSLTRGITGVVQEPYQGAKEDGWTGLLTGGLKGVGGLVVKPITGLLDAASHTSQGIVNTADLLDQRKKTKRIRQPRVVYSESGIVKSFNEEDAEVAYFMIQLDRNRYLNCHFIQQVLESDVQGAPVLFVQYVQWLVLVSVGEHKVLWQVPSSHLLSYTHTKYGLLLTTERNNSKVTFTQSAKTPNQFLIPFSTPSIQSRLIKHLRVSEAPQDSSSI